MSTTSALSRISFREPTGKVTWPCILVAGDEGAGKTWLTYLLSKSPRIGWAFAFDLGEGTADEYAPIGDYKVMKPPSGSNKWTFAELYEQVSAIHDFAAEELAAGHPPVLMTIDTMSDEDAMLKEAMNNRAKTTAKNQAKLRSDPMAELDIPFHIRNETNAKHRRLMTKLLTFPGIVVLIARAKEVTPFENGNPVANAPKIWKPEGHRNLQHDASVVIRMDRDKPAQVVKSRSIHHGIRPGVDAARDLPADWTLEWLIFDILKVDPGSAAVRDLHDLTDGDGEESTYIVNPQVAAQQIADAATAAPDSEDVVALRDKAAAQDLLNVEVSVNGGSGPLVNWLKARHAQMVAMEDQAAAATRPTAAPVTAPAAPPAAEPVSVVRAALEEHADEIAASQQSAEATPPTPVPPAVSAPTTGGVSLSDPPEGATRPEKVRHYYTEELGYQASVLGIARDAYAAQVLGEVPLADLKPAQAQRALVPQREQVVAALRAQGRTVEADAYESVGIGFPANLRVLLEDALGLGAA